MLGQAEMTEAAVNSRLGILWGGLIAGTMDITAAILTWKIKANVPPIRVLQGVASGWTGRDAAIAGGWRTAILGLALHFLIAFTATTVFYLASRKIGFLLSSAWAAGALYGVAVCGVLAWGGVARLYGTQRSVSWGGDSLGGI